MSSKKEAREYKDIEGIGEEVQVSRYASDLLCQLEKSEDGQHYLNTFLAFLPNLSIGGVYRINRFIKYEEDIEHSLSDDPTYLLFFKKVCEKVVSDFREYDCESEEEYNGLVAGLIYNVLKNGIEKLSDDDLCEKKQRKLTAIINIFSKLAEKLLQPPKIYPLADEEGTEWILAPIDDDRKALLNRIIDSLESYELKVLFLPDLENEYVTFVGLQKRFEQTKRIAKHLRENPDRAVGYLMKVVNCLNDRDTKDEGAERCIELKGFFEDVFNAFVESLDNNRSAEFAKFVCDVLSDGLERLEKPDLADKDKAELETVINIIVTYAISLLKDELKQLERNSSDGCRVVFGDSARGQLDNLKSLIDGLADEDKNPQAIMTAINDGRKETINSICDWLRLYKYIKLPTLRYADESRHADPEQERTFNLGFPGT